MGKWCRGSEDQLGISGKATYRPDQACTRPGDFGCVRMEELGNEGRWEGVVSGEETA